MDAVTTRKRIGRLAVALLLLPLAGLAQAGLLDERFPAGELAPGWAVDASPGNSLRIGENGLRIDADENTFAHIERVLDADHVRVSCTLRPGNGISWCTSLFLYWGSGDWCQIGVIPRKDGRYYACVTTQGSRAEHDLTRCRFDAWHEVAIELGVDCLRFLSRSSDQEWRTELVMPRPPRLAGAAKLLVVGKGFGLDATTPDLDCDYGDRGARAGSFVRDVHVVPTAEARMHLQPAELAVASEKRRDPLGRQVLAAGEPTFAAVAALLPPLARPREVVGVPEHRYEIGVDHDGTMQLPDDSPLWEQNGDVAYFTIGDRESRFGAGGCRKHLLEGWLPVVLAASDVDGLVCEETVLGYSAGMRVDAELLACVRLRVTNPGPAARPVRIALAVTSGRVVCHKLPAMTDLAPRAAATFCFEIPALPASGRRPRGIDEATFETRLATYVAAWVARLGVGTQLTVPEERVTNAWRAWLAYGLLDVDTVADRLEPRDGAGFYEEVFGYSAALFCHALDLWGRHVDARRYLDSLLARQRDDGLVFVRYGLPDHGALLFALCEHYRLSGDTAWFRAALPRVQRMCDWIGRARRKSMGDTTPRSVTHGLIRFLPYADYPSATFNYYADAYCCIGLESASRALRALGETARADEVAREAAAYRADILVSMDAAVLDRAGRHILPLEPDTRRILEAGRGQAGGYYGLVASMLLETGFLAVDDHRAQWLRSFLEEENGLVLGMCEFDEGVDHAYTLGYWLDCLRRGAVDRVLLGFYGSLAYGMGRDTFCGVEVTQILCGEPTPTTPHLYSSTQQLRLLRLMLLREDEAVLHVGEGIPRGWLAPGQRIILAGAPTSCGPMSVTYEATPDRLIVTIDPPARRPPAVIRVHLRRGVPISEVRGDGELPLVIATDTVDLRAPARRVRLEAVYSR